MTRAKSINAFLAANGAGESPRAPLAGDASARRYERVGALVLMDAPPGSGEDIAPFLTIGTRLENVGLSVPHIHTADIEQGLILMEDLGDALFSRHARDYPEMEPMLYSAATEAIVAMQGAPRNDLQDYSVVMADLACLALDWYAPEGATQRAALQSAITDTLANLPAGNALVHRDYHADNLLWLPERAGIARVGILDFQDAMAGPLDYDLASLLHDARRVVSDEAQAAARTVWLEKTGRSEADVAKGFAICSVQRGLRILGVFARLCLRDGKAHYPDFIPRTWALLQRDLAHPALADVARIVGSAIPEPTPARLSAIRARAGQGLP